MNKNVRIMRSVAGSNEEHKFWLMTVAFKFSCLCETSTLFVLPRSCRQVPTSVHVSESTVTEPLGFFLAYQCSALSFGRHKLKNMADKLTKDAISLFLDVFFNFDKDGDITISTEELEAVMWNVGKKPNKAGLDALMTEFDADHNGRINFPEFLTMMAKIMGEEENEKEIREAFQALDTNGDGVITSFELRRAVFNLNLRKKPSREKVDDMIQKADTDGDGRVNYQEFVRLWKSEFHH